MDGDSDNCGELGDNDQGGVLQPLAEERDEDPVGNWSADGQENGHVGVLGEGQTVLNLPKEEEYSLWATTEELHKAENTNQCDNPDMWTILAGAKYPFEDSQNLLDEVNPENWSKVNNVVKPQCYLTFFFFSSRSCLLLLYGHGNVKNEKKIQEDVGRKESHPTIDLEKRICLFSKQLHLFYADA